MPRSKTNLQPIGDEFKRRTVFKQRKAGLFKKASELSILCGIDLCAIVYDGPSDSKPDIFSSVSDVSSLLSRFSSISEMDKHKGMTKQHTILQKQIAAKQAELQKIELENREMLRSALNMVDTQLGLVGERIRELRCSERAIGHDDLVLVPCFDWMEPTPGPVPLTCVGPLGEIMQSQDCTLPAYTDEFVQLSDLMVPSVPVSQEGHLSDIVGSSSDIVRSTVINSIECAGSGERVQEGISQVGLNGSDGSDTYSVEFNPKECIDMDELFDSIDIDSIGSLDMESIGSFDIESIGLVDLESFLSFDFESIGSDDRQETNASNSVGPAEAYIGLSSLEELIEMEPLYNQSELMETSSSSMELESSSCDDWRQYLSFSDIEFGLC